MGCVVSSSKKKQGRNDVTGRGKAENFNNRKSGKIESRSAIIKDDDVNNLRKQFEKVKASTSALEAIKKEEAMLVKSLNQSVHHNLNNFPISGHISGETFVAALKVQKEALKAQKEASKG